jgi:hypothetical protein
MTETLAEKTCEADQFGKVGRLGRVLCPVVASSGMAETTDQADRCGQATAKGDRSEAMLSTLR